MLVVTEMNNFTCTADCYPSCSFIWQWKWTTEVLATAHGQTVSILPPESVADLTVFCEAMDTVSHLFISTSILRYVASR